MPKLIEIIGAPGSGKTFISSKLQLVKKKKKQLFFHSSNWRNFKKFQNLNILIKLFIKIKVIFIIAIFYLLFHKRLFFKKIYKRFFFFRTILLIYRHLISIEMLKKVLSDKQYLIMEPGIIMYFLQDYFYSNQKISIQDIKIFNKIFVKTDYIIHSHSKLKLQLKRLKLRTRGLPQRMRGLNKKEIYRVIKKSNLEIRKYISNSNNLNSKIIKINTSNNFKKFENFLK
jgi:hypothetical protein